MMHSSNPPPLNTSFPAPPPAKRGSIIFEPHVLHMVGSIIRDLQFLRQQGYISYTTLEEIVERLPKPVVHTAPHTPPAPSPSSSSSPTAQPEFPGVFANPDIPQKINSDDSNTSNNVNNIIPISSTSSQNPPLPPPPPPPSSSSSSSSQQQQQQQQQQEQQQPSQSLSRSSSITEEEQKSVHQQSPTTPILPPQRHNTETPPLNHSIPPPSSQTQLQENEDDVVNAGQTQLESKPDIPSRSSVYQSISSQPSNLIMSPNTMLSTGAILATRPLPFPPNTSSSSPPRPQNIPNFNDKYEEVEHERNLNSGKDTTLPAYSLAIVEAMWDFNGDDLGDLSFKKGEIIEVVEYVNVDWWRGRIQGTSRIGIFPRVYTKIIPTQVAAHHDQPISNIVNVPNTTAYYAQTQRAIPYSSQQVRPYPHSQSPSQLPLQKLPSTQPPSTQQTNYITYQHIQPSYDTTYNNGSNTQFQYFAARTNTTVPLNNQQQLFR